MLSFVHQKTENRWSSAAIQRFLFPSRVSFLFPFTRLSPSTLLSLSLSLLLSSSTITFFSISSLLLPSLLSIASPLVISLLTTAYWSIDPLISLSVFCLFSPLSCSLLALGVFDAVTSFPELTLCSLYKRFSTTTWVAIPAWSVPGIHNTSQPSMRFQRMRQSWLSETKEHTRFKPGCLQLTHVQYEEFQWRWVEAIGLKMFRNKT